MRKEMSLIFIKIRRIKYDTKINLNTKDTFLIIIFLTLNINKLKFNNLIHFEYAEITKLLHLLFINAILTSIA